MGMWKRVVVISAILCLVLAASFVFLKNTALAPVATSSTTTKKPDQTTKPGFDKHAYSTTDPTSIWIVVNKQHRLTPSNYAPTDLVVPNIPLRVPGNESMQVRHVTATALEAMFAAAKTQSISLMLASGYRSYAYQVNLYNGYVASMGQTAADQQSARPGYSEHQTGLAADIEPDSRKCETQQCFADTSEGKWLDTNAYKYGFII